MTTEGGIVGKQTMEKQMGCMSGFLQIFDRHHILSGKRIYATKRLPSSSITCSRQQSDKSDASQDIYKDEMRMQQKENEEIRVEMVPECVKSVPLPSAEISNPGVQLPVFEFKEGVRSSWKFRESPRLSLDSRASVDAKGSLYPRQIKTNAPILSANRTDETDDENDKKLRSPSVIARLMGLEALPELGRQCSKKPELRRSASESRSRDLIQCRYSEGNNFQENQNFNAKRNVAAGEDRRFDAEKVVKCGFHSKSQLQKQKKSFFDSGDFFPEPKQRESLYGEIEKRLKMRGIDEPAKDLEALKDILEALQLKGLLKKRVEPEQKSSIVKSTGRTTTTSPDLSFRSRTGIRRNLTGVKLRQDRPEISRSSQRRGRNPMSPDRSDINNSNSPSYRARTKPLGIETKRRGNDPVEQRRSSPVHSAKLNTTKISTRSPKRSTPEISPRPSTEEESPSVSESSFISTFSQEKSKTEGKNLLARCDKLLHSIAEITLIDSQPSPISVLDSSFYQDESSPSPVKKRFIGFKDQSVALDGEKADKWSEAVSPIIFQSEECDDFQYITQIIQAYNNFQDEPHLFFLLEKHQYKLNSCNVSRLHRKVVFDTITEILDKKKQLPPWEVVSCVDPSTGKPSIRQIWLEFLRTRGPKCLAGDLFEVVCGVLEKDMAGDKSNRWDDCRTGTSEVVLDIERLIFKDLVGETIRDLATVSRGNRGGSIIPRRKLVF